MSRNPTKEETAEIKRLKDEVHDRRSDLEWAEANLKRNFNNLQKECDVDRRAILDNKTNSYWVLLEQVPGTNNQFSERPLVKPDKPPKDDNKKKSTDNPKN